MGAQTNPFFIVSSGRSGTAMLHKVLSAADGVEMHHEYMVHIVQPLAVRRYLGLASAEEARGILSRTHAAAVRYSEAVHWGDSSNKLSWLIPDLAALIPNAIFVHLVRDGRKVAGSYYRKLSAECYDDRSTAILQAHYDNPIKNPAPPPEKKYWWPVPRKADPRAQNFRQFDQFSRIAWHWAEINRVILAALAALPRAQSNFVRLEDLQGSTVEVRKLCDFLEIPHRDEFASAFARPHNVNRPEDELLTAAQAAQFERLAAAMMGTLGYAGRSEYVVNY
ncbi:MAG TPA: sulfotransferase [Rhizomicrobium sp.]